MQAIITDDLELVLRWRDCGESNVRFALASSSEFTITGRVCVEGCLNYQGEATATFQTMCYGRDLDEFASDLRRLSQGGKSARFLNTGGNFEIRIEPREHKGAGVLQSELHYRHSRLLGDISCRTEFVLPVGAAEDIWGTARAIGELLRLLKVDCRSLFELPE